MYVVRVVPLAALPNTVPQVLDYFWPTPLSEGCLVKVSVGHRFIQGMVLGSSDLAHAKLIIKKSRFGLKKLTSVITDIPQVTSEQMSLARWMSRQYHSPLGLCLKTILPSWMGKPKHLMDAPGPSSTNSAQGQGIDLILSQPDTALLNIERALKLKKSSLIILPEISLVKSLSQKLSQYEPLVFHSELNAKANAQIYRTILSGHDGPVIGTRSAMFLPFHKLNEIIVEDPLNEAYKSDMSPRYVTADVLRELARAFGARLTFLSPALSVTNRYLTDRGVLRLKDEKPHWPDVIDIDMTQERSHNTSLLSRQAQDVLLDSYEDGSSLLVFSPRRSYSSRATCEKCGSSVECANCKIPMRVNRHAGENMLICYHCTSFTEVPKQCPKCHSGRLKASGLTGSQRITEAINSCLDRHGYTKLDIPILDSDLVRDDSDENDVMERYRTMSKPVLVASQKVFSHRYSMSFDNIVVIEADALVYNPDFRTQERLIYQLEKLADFKPQKLYIQRWDAVGAIMHVKERSWDDFYADELRERKAFNWPPFSRITKISFSDKRPAVASKAAYVTSDKLRRAANDLGLSGQVDILGPTPALVERSGGKWTHNILLKTKLRPEKLNILLTHVNPGAIIDIDPRSIT